MTRDEFAAEAHAALDRFIAKSRKAAEADPGAWPDDMSPGEWWEQFITDDDDGGAE